LTKGGGGSAKKDFRKRGIGRKRPGARGAPTGVMLYEAVG